jgi:hypothetical protein
MYTTDTYDDICSRSDGSEEELVHEWRAEQLLRLGLSSGLAHGFADTVDWHQVADLVADGCSPLLALAIAF